MSADVALLANTRTVIVARWMDYLELTKPRIAVMVLVTVALGGIISVQGNVDIALLLSAVLGTGLIAAGASALNQWWERDRDARMIRTQARPLPSGRLTSQEVLVFGLGLAVVGTCLLIFLVNPLSAFFALLSLVLYVWVYTPLKAYTVLNTVVGAVPGALPPVIGWVACRGSVDHGAWSLFLLMFIWQFPHFFAIAWLCRDDYRRAGLRMLPVTSLGLRLTGLHVVSCCMALIPISLWPVQLKLAGPVYFWGALVLGLQFLGYGVVFALKPQKQQARGLLLASLLYLPAVLALLTLDVIRFGN